MVKSAIPQQHISPHHTLLLGLEAGVLFAESADFNYHSFTLSILFAKGVTPLHYAALMGHGDIAQFLVERGAQVNARHDGGRTPLHDAAMKGHSDLVRMLLLSGADINAPDKGGSTPCDVAATYGQQSMVQLLIQNGAKTIRVRFMR